MLRCVTSVTSALQGCISDPKSLLKVRVLTATVVGVGWRSLDGHLYWKLMDQLSTYCRYGITSSDNQKKSAHKRACTTYNGDGKILSRWQCTKSRKPVFTNGIGCLTLSGNKVADHTHLHILELSDA